MLKLACKRQSLGGSPLLQKVQTKQHSLCGSRCRCRCYSVSRQAVGCLAARRACPSSQRRCFLVVSAGARHRGQPQERTPPTRRHLGCAGCLKQTLTCPQLCRGRRRLCINPHCRTCFGQATQQCHQWCHRGRQQRQCVSCFSGQRTLAASWPPLSPTASAFSSPLAARTAVCTVLCGYGAWTPFHQGCSTCGMLMLSAALPWSLWLRALRRLWMLVELCICGGCETPRRLQHFRRVRQLLHVLTPALPVIARRCLGFARAAHKLLCTGLEMFFLQVVCRQRRHQGALVAMPGQLA